jgi:hypothetical protein
MFDRHPELVPVLPAFQLALIRRGCIDAQNARQVDLPKRDLPFPAAVMLIHLPGKLGLIGEVDSQTALPIFLTCDTD